MTKSRITITFGIAAICIAAVTHAQDRMRNPTSRIYVADTNGDAEIDTGKEITDLAKKAVYNAKGRIIETKDKSNCSMVFSNGTGVYFDVNTRVEIRTFDQEPFRPNRTDMDEEPSISKTLLYLDYGTIGVSTSKLVAGSSMEVDTPLASAFILGRQCVVTTDDNVTVISMVQGEATIEPGPMVLTKHLKNAQQIIIRRGKNGEPNSVTIQDIPPGTQEEAQLWLEDRLFTADAARKLVYFEVEARRTGANTVFDGAGPAGSSGSGTDSGGTQIVAVPVVPETPPVQPTISAANLNSHP